MKKYNEYFKILFMTQDEVYEYVLEQAKDNGFTIESLEGGYIYCSIDSVVDKPLLLSHLDTVDTHNKHTDNVTLEDINIDNKVLSVNKTSSCVLGGDDRSGVWVMLQLMRNEQVKGCYNYLFTCDEEIGGLGGDVFVTNTSIDYTQATCFISLDRRGQDEVATYGCDNEDLIAIFTSRGYKEMSGSFTDCLTLSNSCEVACINLSVGYENEHTSKEIQHIPTLFNLEIMLADIKLIRELSSTVFTYDYKPYYKDYINEEEGVLCECCSSHDLLYSYSMAEGHEMMVCEYCLFDMKSGSWAYDQQLSY